MSVENTVESSNDNGEMDSRIHLITDSSSLSAFESTSGLLNLNLNTGETVDRICRICWIEDFFDDLVDLSCNCRGTMGKVHSQCLKKWENIRRGRRCEICKELYGRERNLLAIFRTFFQHKYAGVFCNKIINISATTIMAYTNIILGEINVAYLIAVDRASSNRTNFSYPLMIISAAIFPYFIINYLTVDYVMTEVIDCFNLISEWWENES